MVEDTRKTLHNDTFKPVNLPEPIHVEEDACGLPMAVIAKRRRKINVIEDHWRIDDEWWRDDPISRLYYAVMLDSGLRLVLYKDLINNAWYRQIL